MGRLGIHSFVRAGGQTRSDLEMALEKSAEHSEYSRLPTEGGWKNSANAAVDGCLTLACEIWRDTKVDKDPLPAHAKQSTEFKWTEAERRRVSNGGI